MKRWHTNKTNPKAYEPIIVIYKEPFVGEQVEISECMLSDNRELYYYDDAMNPLWKDMKKEVKLWAYVDKYFENEIKK